MTLVRKKKKCARCKNERYIFSRGMCHSCYRATHKPKFKKRKPINRISNKGRLRNDEYRKSRKNFLSSHCCCEVKLPGCTVPNSSYEGDKLEVHHKKGRIGDLLTDQRYFLAVCSSCHRYLEDHPEFAVSNGWSLSRHKNDQNEQHVSKNTSEGKVAEETGDVPGERQE